jgi:hypothetical protein
MAVALASAPALAVASAPRGVASAERLDSLLAPTRVVMPVALIVALRAVSTRVPSYSRQTGLPCSTCHYQFPQLTPFGRLFKLNGYTLTGLKMIRGSGDSTATNGLSLSPIPPLSAMVVTSMTTTARAVPGTQNNTAAFPQQLSVFLAGQIAPRMGAFAQLTYADVDGTVSIDNVDLRFASHASLAGRDLLYGLTLNNNPTVQDVWNSQGAWGFPFIASEVAPAGLAGTVIDGGLGQQVVGLGAYTLWANLLYAEGTFYRSAPQGQPEPLDSSVANVTRNVVPYWRLALQHQIGPTYLMIGTYGLSARLFPAGVRGETNRFTDVGVDAQVEHALSRGSLIGRASYLHERQKLAASVGADPAGAANASNTLEVTRVNLSWLPGERYSLTGGWFGTTGSSDAILYAPAPVVGSATGAPNTSGGVAEATFSPWQNTRLGVQYVAFRRFNGASHNYDGSGRDAADNNTLYSYFWFAF